MTAVSLQALEEKIARRADQINATGGTDLTVAVCSWTADMMVVVLEWFNGDEPQREIVGGIPLADHRHDPAREIHLGQFVVAGVNSLSIAFRAIQQAQACDQPIWQGLVDGQPVTVRRRPVTDAGTADSSGFSARDLDLQVGEG